MFKKKKIDKYSWDNISAEKYFDINEVLYDDGLNDLEKTTGLISIVEDMDVDDVLALSLEEYGMRSQKLRFLNDFKPKEYNKLKNIDLQGLKCYIIDDTTKLTYGQFVDYQSFVELPFSDNYNKILSIFIVPEGHKYNDGYDIADVQHRISQLPFAVVEGLLGFFLMRYRRLLGHFLTYLKKEMKTMTADQKKVMEESLAAFLIGLQF